MAEKDVFEWVLGCFSGENDQRKIANDDNQMYLWMAERSGTLKQLTRMLSWSRGQMTGTKGREKNDLTVSWWCKGKKHTK